MTVCVNLIYLLLVQFDGLFPCIDSAHAFVRLVWCKSDPSLHIREHTTRRVVNIDIQPAYNDFLYILTALAS